MFSASQSTCHFLARSTVSHKSYSTWEGDSSSGYKSDTWLQVQQKVESSADIAILQIKSSERSLMYSRQSLHPRMELWEKPVLTRFSSKFFPSRTTQSPLLTSNDKKGHTTEIKFHRSWVCVEDQHAKPCWKPWTYQVPQLKKPQTW